MQCLRRASAQIYIIKPAAMVSMPLRFMHLGSLLYDLQALQRELQAGTYMALVCPPDPWEQGAGLRIMHKHGQTLIEWQPLYTGESLRQNAAV